MSPEVEGRKVSPRDGLRVMLICDWFLKYVAELAIGLAAEGHQVVLLCRTHAMEFGNDPRERAVLLERVRGSGVSVHEVPGRPASFRAAAAAFKAIARARRHRPEIVHAQEAVYDPRLLAATGRQPVVLTLHDPEPHLGVRFKSKHQLLRRLWRLRANTFIVHSEHLVPQLGRDRDRVAVVPHGADLRPQAERVPTTPRVLLFGRLEPYKGVSVLLEAMEHIWESRPDVRLTIAGTGSESALIPDDSRIDARIGYIPEDSVDEMFASATVVVLPYLDASQSGVGLLAIARGVPVIVTDVGGLPDLVIDRTYVVPPGDAASLAAAILKHLDDDSRVRQSVLKSAAERFGWRIVAKATARVYEEVLTRS